MRKHTTGECWRANPNQDLGGHNARQSGQPSLNGVDILPVIDGGNSYGRGGVFTRYFSGLPRLVPHFSGSPLHKPAWICFQHGNAD